MKVRHLIHLHWRSGFGITPSSLKSAKFLSKQNNVNSIFDISKKIEPIQLDLSEFNQFLKTPYKKYKNIHGAEAATKLRQKSQRKVRELNFEWLKKIASSDCIFREKMTLFWANVFVCRDNHIFHIIQFNNTLRKHALGDFGAFVKAVARTPSMLKYLNNNRNVKLKPNENFARELLELFTLGLGNYSEHDIKEAARAFTGWNFKANGDFIIRTNKHDENSKTFLGVSGNLGGDEVIDIILKQRQCAEFICKKIYT
ncbi:MAG: DUF1800 family protein, partial [Flavobacteriaceae bacterium]|nr:DUF1800 family protein [Flavobacteriaceae bacterium]